MFKTSQLKLAFLFLIVGFWALWFSLAAITNIFDLLHAWGFISPHWTFRSGNLDLIKIAMRHIAHPDGVMITLFVFDCLAQAVIAFMFWKTLYCITSGQDHQKCLYTAFFLNIGLWCLFLVTEELLLAYSFETVHMRLLLTAMISLIFLEHMSSSSGSHS